MKTLLIAFTLSLFASPAHAAFTAGEATQIENIRVNVVGKLASALEAHSIAIQQDQDTLAMRRSAIIQTNYAMQQVLEGMSRLVDVVSPANFVAPDPATRANRVALAWGDFDQAVVYIDAAIVALNGATGTNMLQAKNTHLPGAKTAINAIDRNLSYSDARPPSYPALIGPHGDYDRTQALLARAWAYQEDVISFAFTAYGQGNPAPTANWYGVLQGGFANYKSIADGLAIMAGVGQTSVNQFWRVLAYTQRLTDGAAGPVSQRYRSQQNALTVAPHASLMSSIQRVAESWVAMDQAIWEILVFLNCSQTSDPAGCATLLP